MRRLMWLLAARAQQGGRMRRIGVLMNLTAEDPESSIVQSLDRQREKGQQKVTVKHASILRRR
jgi:hypothetical protein